MFGSRKIEQDYNRAVYYLEIASKLGSVTPSGMLAYIQSRRLPGVTELPLQRVEELTRYSANRGDVNGSVLLIFSSSLHFYVIFCKFCYQFLYILQE